MLDLANTSVYHPQPRSAFSEGQNDFAEQLPTYHKAPDLDVRLAAAWPRLMRLARALGVPRDAVDDIVQESLLAAWRQYGRLRDAERFDAWLDAICRNHCRMYLRMMRREAEGAAADGVHVSDERRLEDISPLFDLPDPGATDPLEELDREDLTLLVDRALGHLPASARGAMRARYLEEQPEREVAARLGVSVNVLEARLHRARKQLRAVLAGPLREEAQSLGLLVAEAEEGEWRQTSIWCNLCGRRRLLGRFESQPDGTTAMRMRCPECSQRYGFDIYRGHRLLLQRERPSFRPALTHAMRGLARETMEGLTSGLGICHHCGRLVPVALVLPGERASNLVGMSQAWVTHQCHCGKDAMMATALEPATWFHPAMQRFIREHPRWIVLPDAVIEREGMRMLQFNVGDAGSRARLALFADPRTLRIMDAFEEAGPPVLR